MADSAGFMELASNAGDFFTNSTLDDLMIRTTYPTQDILIGSSNSQSTLTITSNAVGILTTPAYTLDVNGNINFSGNLTQNGTLFTSGGGGNSQWSNNSSNVFVFGSNVGIGISNPSYPLQIVTTASNTAVISTGTTSGGFGRLIFGNTNHGIGRGINISTATNGNDVVVHTAGTGSIVLCPNATENFRVNSSGNVGIGTSTPSYKLDVIGDSRLSGKVYVDDNSSASGSRPSKGYYVWTDGRFGMELQNEFGTWNTSFITRVTDGGFSFKENDGTLLAYMNNAGNLGIGVSNPSTPLHISARSNNNPALNGLYIFNSNNTAGNNAIATVRVGGASAGNPYYSLDTSVSGWSIGIDNADSDKLKIISGWDFMATPSWTRMTLDSSGNVGIGVSNPTAPIHVSARSNNNPQTNGIYLFNSNNTAGNHAIITTAVAGTSGGNPYISTYVSGVPGWSFGVDNADSRKFKIIGAWDFMNSPSFTRMTIDDSGNVGINTSNPAYRLDVLGTSRFTGTDTTFFNTNTAHILLSNDKGTSILIAAPYSAGQYSSDANSNDFVIRNNATGGKLHFQSGTAGAALTVNSNNNIGISTGNPAYKLDVNGVIKCNGFINSSYYVTFDTTANAYRDIADYTSQYGSMSFLISVLSAAFGSTCSKTYAFTSYYGMTSGSWHRCLPINMGWLNSDDVELLVNCATETISFRVVHKNNIYASGVTVNIAYQYTSNYVPTITDKTGNAQATDASWATYPLANVTQITQVASNVGIGTSSPSVKLHVEDGNVFIGDSASGFSTTVPITSTSTTTYSGYRLHFDNSFNGTAGTGSPANKIVLHNNNYTCGFGVENGGVTYHSGSNHNFYVGATNASTYGTNSVVIGNNVGLGTTAPTQKLHVIGNILASGDITAFSDKRLKYNISIIDNALNKLHKLNGYTFNLNNHQDNVCKVTEKHTGLVAQEVLEVLPEAIYQDVKEDNTDGYYSIAYGNVLGLVVEAIKEIDKKYQIDIAQIKQALSNLGAC